MLAENIRLDLGIRIVDLLPIISSIRVFRHSSHDPHHGRSNGAREEVVPSSSAVKELRWKECF